MNRKTKALAFIVGITLLPILLIPGKAQLPVTPHASPEATALLEFIYSISGKYTLTGQHNYPATKDRNSQFAIEYSGKTPAVWSTDMGFAEEGDTDSYLARPDIVKEAIRQHKKGAIITICWHAVPPTADEPVTFQPAGPFPPDSLASVQGQMLDEQFRQRAESEIQQYLLFKSLEKSEAKRIEPKQEEIEKETKELLGRYEKEEEKKKIEEYLKTSEGQENLASSLRRKNLIDLLIKNAKIVDQKEEAQKEPEKKIITPKQESKKEGKKLWTPNKK